MRPHEIGHEELCAGEGGAAQGGRGEHAAQPLPAAHHQDQVCRHEERDGGANASHAGAEAVERQPGGDGEGGDGNTDGAEGHRGGVGEQADGGSVERFEAEAGEHGRGHGYRSAEARRAFEKCAKGEGDEQGLQAPVAGQVADGILQDFEPAALQRDAVEQNRAEDHPADGEEAEGGAKAERTGDQPHWHAVGRERHNHRDAQPGDRRLPGGEPSDTE